jgi:hypothetical protein
MFRSIIRNPNIGVQATSTRKTYCRESCGQSTDCKQKTLRRRAARGICGNPAPHVEPADPRPPFTHGSQPPSFRDRFQRGAIASGLLGISQVLTGRSARGATRCSKIGCMSCDRSLADINPFPIGHCQDHELATQAGDLVALFGDGLLQDGDLAQQVNQQSLKL